MTNKSRTTLMTLRHLTILFGLSIWLLAFPKHAAATHVMGGDLTYKHLHDSTYELKFLIYRDCNPGNFSIDQSIRYWVYDGNKTKLFITRKDVPITGNGAFKVNPEAPNCVVPSGVCIEAGEYIDTVTLGTSPNGYIVTWYRLERNHIIDNLKRCVSSANNSACDPTWFRPCNTSRNNPYGMVWTAEIPTSTYKNSSPQFLTAPVPYFCKGVTNYFNHVAYDPDGDSLYFENVTPLSPEACMDARPSYTTNNPPPAYGTVYKNTVYQQGYSVNKPFGSTSATIKVDGSTGEITANPRNAGNYVIAVKISEYRVDPVTRKSTYLGSIRRDLQFISGNCPSNAPPKLTSGGKNVYHIDPDSTLTFKISGTDNQDTVYLKATGNVFGGSNSSISKPFATFNDTSGYKSVEQTFSWTPTCDHITYTTPHVFSIFLSDEGCNTLQRTFSVFVNQKPILRAPEIQCLSVESNGNIKITWDSLDNVSDAFKQVNLYRRNPNGSRVLLKSFSDTTTLSYTDNTVSNVDTDYYRYYLKTENTCNLAGRPSDSLQNLRLSYNALNDKTIELEWGKFSPTGTVDYYVQKKFVNAFVNIDTTTELSDTVYGCDVAGEYRVVPVMRGVGNLSCESKSNVINVTTEDVTAPDAPTFKHASYNSWRQVYLEITESPSDDVKSYRFLRSRNGGSFSTLATINTNASSISYLDNISNNGSNSFCYRVYAIDECDNDGDTSEVHCPVNLKARTGQLEAILEWDDYEGYEIDSVVVQRYDTLNAKWQKWATVAANVGEYKDSIDIVCNFKYTYRLASHQKDGNYVSISDSAFTRPIDTIKPPRINTVFASIQNNSTANIKFARSPDKDVDEHIVIATASYNNQNYWVDTTLTTSLQDTISLSINLLSADSFDYQFQVFAIDSCNNNISATAETHKTVQLRGEPKNLSVLLDWNAYQGFGVDRYDVEIFDNGNWRRLRSLPDTTTRFLHDSLPCNITNSYRIRALGNTFKGENSLSDVISLTPYDSLPPASPEINYVTVLNDNTVEIDWNHSSSTDAQNYIILSSTNGGPDSILDTIARNDNLTTHTYRHNNLNTKDSFYCYTVLAYDTCNNNVSQFNISHCAIQLDGVAANKATNLRWSTYFGINVDYYAIEQLSNNQWTEVARVNGNINNYNHVNLDCYEPYTYRIKMMEDSTIRDSAYSDTITLVPFDTIAPAAPTLRTASIVHQDSIRLEWDHSLSDDVDRYIIYHQHPDSSQLRVYDTVGYTTAFTMFAQDLDTSHQFALKAIDFCRDNTSGFSATHSTLFIESNIADCANQVVIEWNAYTQFVNGVDRYELYRSIDGNSFKLLTTTSNTQYTDQLNPYHSYRYQIRAIEAGTNGYSAQSAIYDIEPYKVEMPTVKGVSVETTDPANGEVLIEWESQADVAYIDFQRLYYRAPGSSSFNLLANNLLPIDSSFLHQNLNTTAGNHHYFLVNVDSCGNTSDTLSIHRSMDMQFSIGQLRHQLQWTTYQGFNVQQYYLQQKVGNSYVFTDTLAPNATQFNKFPAPCNQVITYRIAAENPNGYLTYSDTTSGLAIDLQMPDKPTLQNVSVNPNGYIQVQFNGVDSQDVFAYDISRQRAGNPFLSRGYVFYPGQKQQHVFNDTTNINAGPFTYVVVALDSCLNANASDTFITMHLDGQPDQFANNLNWSRFSGYGFQQFEMQQLQNGSWSRLANLQPADTQYTHSNISCQETFTYRLAGVNGNDTTFSNLVTLTPIDTTIPEKPIIATASVNEQQQVEVQWQFDQNSDVKTISIYKSINGGNFNFLSDTTYAEKWVDRTAQPRNNTYAYYITFTDSCDATHISDASDTVSTFNFSIEPDTCEAINRIAWTPIQYLGNGVDQYLVERLETGTSTWSILDTLADGTTQYIDSSAEVGKNYCFRIAAIDEGSGNISYTDTICIQQNIFPVPPIPALRVASVVQTDPVNGEVEIQWPAITTAESPNLLGYQVLSSDTVNGVFRKISPILGRNDTQFSHFTNTLDARSYYRVVSINQCGVRSDTSYLHSPAQLHVGGLNFAAELSWDEYFGYPVSRYEIERSVNGATFQVAGTTDKNTFVYLDNYVSCGDEVRYRVKAISASGIASYSDIETTIGTDTVAPQPIKLGNVSVSNNGADFTISWDASPEPDVKSYNIVGKSRNALHWDTLAKNVQGTNATIPNINPESGEIFEFKISPNDSCGNSQVQFSPSHHSIGLLARGGNGRVFLEWSNYRGWSPRSFKVYRNGTVVATIDAEGAARDSIFRMIDSVSVCDTTLMQYWVEASGAQGNVSLSNVDTTLTVDKAPPASVYLRNATVVNNVDVALTWTTLTDQNPYTYLIQEWRKGDWVTLEELDQNESRITLTNVDFRPNQCYRVLVRDVCGNLSKPSNRACVMYLEGGDMPMANSLEWTPYMTWRDSVSYYEVHRSIDSLTWRPVAEFNKRVRTFVDTNLRADVYSYCYQVYAYEKGGGFAEMSKSNVYCVTQKPTVYIPNTFSPGYSENLNDEFGPQGAFLPDDYSMTIYSRWGQKVFETHKGGTWDGKLRGEVIPNGVYFYTISFTADDGKEYLYEGSIKIFN